MNNEPEQKCEKCKWFDCQKWRISREEGFCNYNPPVVGYGMPKVHVNQWCHCFEMKENAK